jgi:DNA invertase Pin-like site-specific DNA recombinase
MPIYGYARVSTLGQKLDVQLKQLRAEGCDQIFCEKKSGMQNGRRELRRMLRSLKPGDTVIFTALDRLTRSGTYMTLHFLNEISSRGATYRSLVEPWVDTTSELGEILAALVGYLNRKVREDMLRCAAKGREDARAKGVIFGRKPKLSALQQQEARARRAEGEPQRLVALTYNVSCSTISRLSSSSSKLAAKKPAPS